ncbi:DUF4861 domain-containing protein [Parabacteroides sp. OttesenSCG-928-J18]|nr:DUF4861 domain-containing protein [Parabacteroides sp. OttesenSCG-928-J18]
MKKMIMLLVVAMLTACGEKKDLQITVANPLALDRQQEMIEISASQTAAIQARYADGFIITDADGLEIPYQITHDQMIILQASVEADAQRVYTLKAGTPQAYETIATGKQYPERVDDIAWENDRVAFRAYGPALQATGERAFGYDIWAKKVAYPVVEARYAKELNPETLAQIAELHKSDPKAAQELAQSVSYHVDHGDGLDYYSVGPTLGAGTSALMNAEGLIMPYAYKTYTILDNGPLRFTVSLTYNPLKVGENENVIENRIISLDAGSQLNKATIRFENLTETTPLATGLVMHAPSEVYEANAEKGYIAYADPIDPLNGQIFVGAVVPRTQPLKEAAPAYGHVLAISDYKPGSDYTYYFGGGWSKYGFESAENWFTYMRNFTEKVNNPLSVSVK